MQILQNSIFFLLGFFLLTPTKCLGAYTNTDAINDWLTQVCSYDDPESRYVRFPFRIQNESIPMSCGYPGFDLFCDGADKLKIDLHNAGVFTVEAIDYTMQEILLNDPNNCVATRLLSLNVSQFDKSPFITVEKTYWLYNCSIEFLKSNITDMKPIKCLSGESYGVAASSYEATTNNGITTRLCVNMGTIQVPIGSQSDKMEPFDIRGGIRLSWSEPGCNVCYQKHGKCGFKSSSSSEVRCFSMPHHGIRRETIIAIALAFAAPLFFASCGITYFSIKAICFRRRRNNARIALTMAITQQPQTYAIPNGLDRSTIESYPKVVLGESRRLPKPDDKSCPICLGEYLPKETLRTLPDCSHCFHAECIDEWLQLNASCPVCRNTPENSPTNNS